MKTKPRVIYYRWVFSPSTGDVSLSHNHEGHPADIVFHEELAEDRPEHDLQGGFATRAVGGWKVTDEDHKPITEPFTKRKVIEAIEHAEVKAERNRTS
jgi:hypothetical protein